MDDSIAGLASILGVIAIQALVTLAYAAVTNTKAPKVRDWAEAYNSVSIKAFNMAGSENLLITYQTATGVFHFIIASLTIQNVANPIIADAPAIAPILIYITTLAITLFLSISLGNIVPESVGSRYANLLANVSLTIMRVLLTVFSPMVFMMLKLSTLLSALFKSEGKVNTITEEEIMTVVEAGHTGGTIEDEEKEMIYSVLQLGETYVSEVMVPRIDIVAIEINRTLDEAGKLFISTGFSRIPVYEDNLDNIRGLLYAKDLLAYWAREDEQPMTIKQMMRPAYFVPETKRADELLKDLQTQKIHLAIVVDEYGGTAGMVTIENLIEEIVGDIQDEYDVDEEEEYTRIDDDHYVVDASIDLDDFNDLLDVDLPTDDNDTLGGFIYSHLGRIPLVDEEIQLNELTLKVLSVDGRRIRKVDVVHKRPQPIDADGLTEEDTTPTPNPDNTHSIA
ncbi:MAG: HlyC/CorC family transporter [Phototrophicales bacterium]|nr:MAG: HlyC/CorC family transporter [Phototrophicales bacterium]